jgi:RNA polymerase sigma-70 factor, ECF subfamily
MAIDPAWTDGRDAESRWREDDEDRLLVLGVQRGESGAYRELYERYIDRVYGYLRLSLGHSADAEDATQQVFLNAWRALGGYDVAGAASFRSWLFVIAHNLLVDFRRGRRHVRVLAPAEVAEHIERAGSVPDLAERASRWDWDRLVGRLCKHQRQVLTLRFRCDLTTGEIARLLEISEQAVHKVEQRALAALEGRLVDRSRPGRVLRVSMGRRDPGLPVLRARRMALQAA